MEYPFIEFLNISLVPSFILFSIKSILHDDVDTYKKLEYINKAINDLYHDPRTI